MLSDGEIREEMEAGRIVVTPEVVVEQRQPASLDLRLSGNYKDLSGRENSGTEYYLMPGEFMLGSTLDNVTLPADIAAQVAGRSSWGRKGLLVHCTAGFIDPGFSGTITLELKNVGPAPIALPKHCRIAQLVFHRLGRPAVSPYAGQYQNQEGPTA